MTERSFDSGFWSDPHVQPLTKDAKLLWIYLWTNPHCNQAGLYEITPKTITFETGLRGSTLPELFEALSPKVVWYADLNLVWVKNFLKRQNRSPKFLIAVARCLDNIPEENIVKDFLAYNHTLSIPYGYPTDKVFETPDTLHTGLIWSDLNNINTSKAYEAYLNAHGGQIDQQSAQDLGTLIDEYGDDTVAKAIIAANKSKSYPRCGYIEGVLRRWQSENERSTNTSKKEAEYDPYPDR